jgi:hypothetical protein
MKYIITESQYDNLFTDKNYRLVASMWDKGMDTSDIAEFTGLRESVVIYLLREKQIDIDCAFADTLLPTLFKTSLVNKNFRSGDEILRLEWTFGAFITFNYDDPKYELRGYATPYWNRECITPVDSNYFLDKETNEYEEDNDSFGMNINNTPSSFNSIQEFIDFLNNDYPKELFRTIQKIIKKRKFN